MNKNIELKVLIFVIIYLYQSKLIRLTKFYLEDILIK
jgi:hypothetical protein